MMLLIVCIKAINSLSINSLHLSYFAQHEAADTKTKAGGCNTQGKKAVGGLPRKVRGNVGFPPYLYWSRGTGREEHYCWWSVENRKSFENVWCRIIKESRAVTTFQFNHFTAKFLPHHFSLKRIPASNSFPA